jgi:flap endonuclease-1
LILIEAMGIPLLTTSAETPHEAEALGAVLQASGLVDAVVSEDSDVLLYDATMLRNALGHKVPATLVNGKAVREALGFDREQFIDMCLLCGSDFAETLPGYVLAERSYRVLTWPTESDPSRPTN